MQKSIIHTQQNRENKLPRYVSEALLLQSRLCLPWENKEIVAYSPEKFMGPIYINTGVDNYLSEICEESCCDSLTLSREMC